MLIYRCLYMHIKHNSYFIIGTLFGILLSLNYFKYEDEQSCMPLRNQAHVHNEQFSVTTDEYEPRFMKNKSIQPKKLNQNLMRPRYYSTELGIREKLFVAVVTSEQNIKHAIAINETLARHSNKIKFFITASVIKRSLNLANIVVFTDTRELLKPFHLIKYLCDNYLNDYDYYFLVSDVAYVDGRKLVDLVDKISVSEDVYMGTKPDSDSEFCGLDAGILISNSVLKNVKDNLDWCVRNSYSKENYENVGRCIIHSSNLKCKSTVQDQYLSSYRLPNDWNINSDLQNLIREDNFNRAISLYPIKNYSDIYSLQLYFARLHLEKINKEIITLSKFVSENSHEGHWPAGLRNDPTLPRPHYPDRFHQPKYSMINLTHVLLPDDYNNVMEHSDAEKKDIDNVLKFVINKVENENSNLKYHSLVDGYRRHDPSKGMNYIFDMNFFNNEQETIVMKRMEVFKPLAKAIVLTTPYVTENTRIMIILPVWMHDVAIAKEFVKNFQTTFLERRDKVSLLMAFMYSSEASSRGPDDPFRDLKTSAIGLSEKYRVEGLKVIWVSIRLPAVPHLFDETGLVSIATLDLTLSKVPLDGLVLLAKPQAELKPDYLNRVRLNTVSGYQVFSPIGFQLYHPKLSSGPIPCKGSGRFAPWDYSLLSFYNRDYISVRKMIQLEFPIVRTDKDIEILVTKKNSTIANVFEVFVKFSPNLHAFRAIEPGVVYKYDESIYCPPSEIYKNSTIVDESKENYVQFGRVMLTEKCLDKLSKDNFETMTIGNRNQLGSLILNS